MTDNLWTKGPWEVGQTSTYETALVASASGLVVACAAWDGGSGCHLEIKNVANAHLIASAPTMAEALERLVKLTPEAANASDARDLHLTVCAIAESALALARGEKA